MSRHWHRVCLFKSSLPALSPGHERGHVCLRNLLRSRDKVIQRLNGLSAAMAGFAVLPNNSSLPLGNFRAIARSGIFDRLRLRRREAFADLLGAARGIKRRLRVALELRHHLARDQFVAARCC